jgi:hypothetical protein
MSKEGLFKDALDQHRDAVRFSLSAALAEACPDLALLETEDRAFDIEEFSRAGQCKIRPMPEKHSQFKRYWNPKVKKSGPWGENAWREVEWEGKRFQVVTLVIHWSNCDTYRHYILAPTQDEAVQFFETVCTYCGEVRGEVLVYDGGHWSKSSELFGAIQKTSYEDVVLADNQRDEIKTDFERFFAMRATYEQYSIPWKRGVLFLGPPGNGKTYTIKALCNGLKMPCLCVRSFKAEYRTDHDTIHEVFEKARATAPCLLILEDLDSLVDQGNRSCFLNEMDGFAANTGIVTLATANYPERLDPAILDRPSRFDRKYHFTLPAAAERRRYIELWNRSLQEEMRLLTKDMDRLTEATDEFSFAYLKELFLSGMMQWIDNSHKTSMAGVLLGLSGSLKEQMRSGKESGGTPDLPPPADRRAQMMARMMKR